MRASVVRSRAAGGVRAMATCVFVVLMVVVVVVVVISVATHALGSAVGRIAPRRATTMSFMAVEVVVLVVLRGSRAPARIDRAPYG